MMRNKIQNLLDNFIESHKDNVLPKEFNFHQIFSKIFFDVAQGSDPLFLKYKEIIGKYHFTPAELWSSFDFLPRNIHPEEISVLSFGFSFSDDIKEEGSKSQISPPELYLIARNYADTTINTALVTVQQFLVDLGFNVALCNQSHIVEYVGYSSSWSERHIAYAAGLGSFSLTDAFISDYGTNIRLGSIITDAQFPLSKRKIQTPYSNCLYFVDKSCKKCIERCPINAISEQGHDKELCHQYGQKIAQQMMEKWGALLKPSSRRVKGEVRQRRFPAVGCALCQFDVPCMNENPTKKIKK
ncbi:MAG: hypothetical protein ACTSQ5_00765 [Promethearchaeota archaeon]